METHPEPSFSAKSDGLLELPEKWLKRLFIYLNPADCFNLANCSQLALQMVRRRSKHEISAVHLRFDDEKSCVGAYFEKLNYTAHVFYTWRVDEFSENRTYWSNTYHLKSHKFQSYMYNHRIHPKPVQQLQQQSKVPIDWFMGMLDTYYSLLLIFPNKAPYTQIGVNMDDKKSCEAFSRCGVTRVNCIRLFGQKLATTTSVKEVLKPIVSYDAVKVGYQIGPSCLHRKVTNATCLVLEDPEWITKEHLLNLNCLTIDLGHNKLTSSDLNAFLKQWMDDEMRCERLDVHLSPEAFASKKAIFDGLPIRNWDPRTREGEYFEPERYITKTRIRDPTHFLDCKQGKDLIRKDGRLATIQFHAKKMIFVVWRDRFPYLTLKRARRRREDQKAKMDFLRRLKEAVAELQRKEAEEWTRKLDVFEATFSARKDAEAEHRAAKRKYFMALKEFMDTSAPKPKRKVLETITIFKQDDEIP